MKRATILLATAAFAACSLEAGAAPPKSVRVYYFGNSLTENTIPPFHAELGRSAGKQWTVGALIAGGAPLFHLRERLEQDQWAFGGRSRTTLTGRGWDAITLQPATWLGLRRKGSETSGWVKEPDREVGDIESSSKIIDMFLAAHPAGRVYVFGAWPGMPSKQTPGGPPPGPQGGDKTPDKEAFDYARHWLSKYDPDAKWKGDTFATRDYQYQLVEALKAKYEKLAKADRLAMIPVGDVYLALNEKLRKGMLKGSTDIEDFYTDRIHQRSGLPRYTAAATFYAVLFQEHPGKLDWKVYNNVEAYRNTNNHPDPMQKFYVHVPDLGEHFPITAEGAKLVNDTIWEVVKGHPHTGIR